MDPAPLQPAQDFPADLRTWIERLAARPWAQDFYLAGSSALTLYIGHRDAHSLDLMSQFNRLASPDRRDLLFDLLELDPDLRVETARDGFLYVRTGAGIALRFFYYPYPLIDPEEFLDNLQVASLVDLGLMKLGAIISRGTRRDFVDLYLLCRRLPLTELLQRSEDKFGHVRDFPLQALKGLADRSLIEGEPMPRLSKGLAAELAAGSATEVGELSWTEVERWLDTQIHDLGRQKVGLDTVED